MLDREIANDKRKFIEETCLAFSVSHPGFIRKLEEACLTEDEINMACLLGLGLKGKDVKIYMDNSRYYHLSSSIRKKLRIEANDKNLNKVIQTMLHETHR